MKPLHDGAWDELKAKYQALHDGPEGPTIDALEEIEANHRETFDAFAVFALSLRCDPYPYEDLFARFIRLANRTFGKSYTPTVQRKIHRSNLARTLHLFLNFMKPRWGGASGILARYREKHGKDLDGAGAVRRCLRAAGYPVPKEDVADFGRRYCYRPGRVDRILAEDFPGMPAFFALPDLVEMVRKEPDRMGEAGHILISPSEPSDPDAPARLAQDPPDRALVAFLCLCLNYPKEARGLALAVPSIGDIADHVEAWRRTLYKPSPVPPVPPGSVSKSRAKLARKNSTKKA